ncbi:hypothetical protein V6N13_048774 [Hibiscus sabdariffa]
MPVPTSPSTDCRIWKFERFGVYTVSSGYNFLIRSSYEQHEVFDQHSVNSKKSFYGSLWVLKVPPKGRGNSRASCVFMFFSQQLMQELGQFIDFPPLDQNWFSWLSHLFAILSKDRCALLITAVWALWYYHNNEVHENRTQRESFSGAIVRGVNAANTHPHSFVLDQEMANARSCEQAVYLAQDLDFRRVIFEGEALSVISQINSSADNISDINAIL